MVENRPQQQAPKASDSPSASNVAGDAKQGKNPIPPVKVADAGPDTPPNKPKVNPVPPEENKKAPRKFPKGKILVDEEALMNFFSNGSRGFHRFSPAQAWQAGLAKCLNETIVESSARLAEFIPKPL